MIICASRRTDIPAFHSEWFIRRLRQGRVMVRNPIQKDVVHDVSLDPKDVDCIVFISKDPQPMERYLKEIEGIGHRMMFQITMNPYGKDIEPNVPDINDVTRSFKRISSFVGKEHMLWRYDPVIFSDRFDIDYHIRRFGEICSELEGYTERCTFSFLTRYDKISANYDSGLLREASGTERKEFCRRMVPIAESYGIELSSCCIDPSSLGYGVKDHACLDADDLRRLGIPCEIQSIPIREHCRCVKSIDIGMYDTCLHNCVYCYANTKNDHRRMLAQYDPDNEMLYGKASDGDRIVKIGRRVNARITDY